MRKIAVSFTWFLAFFLMAGAQQSAQAQEGKTIFGENKKATFKAMKANAKALDVKCVYCHVKEGGKMKYKKETKHKKVGRAMKLGMVDSLVIKGEITVEIPEEEGKFEILAVLQAKGDNAGIHLTATTPDKKTYKSTLALPKEGESITCRTCHQGKLHFLTHDHKEEK